MGTTTITLTGGRPVSIDEDAWPVVADASTLSDHNGQDAPRGHLLRVRQHSDGRTLVYGVYRTLYQGERGCRAGELLEGADTPAIIGSMIAAESTAGGGASPLVGVFIVLWILAAGICMQQATEKNRSVAFAAVMGLLFGVVAVFGYLVISPKPTVPPTQ